MGAPAGAKNAYRCDECGRYTVVVHRDAGTTPMFLACRADGELTPTSCPGRAVSMMYPAEPWPEGVPTEPAFEWVAPSKRRILRVKRRRPLEAAHYERGGLELRRIA